MPNPLISVVIPITRYEQELSEALDSVLRQTYEKYEIVIVDNQATDGTRSIAKKWQEKYPSIIRIVFEERKGVSYARNRGILSSNGQYVAFLDSDDRMRPDRLAKQCNVMRADDNIVLVGSWLSEISPDGLKTLGNDCRPDVPRWGKVLFQGSSRWDSDPFFEPQTSTFFFRTSDAKKIGLFDERFNPFWLEDTDFSFRLYENGIVRIIPESLVEYRTHSESDSIRRIFDLGLIVKHDIFFSKLKDKYFDSNNKDSRTRFKKLKSRWLRESGVKLMYYPAARDIGKGMIKRAFQENPFDSKNIETVFRTFLPRTFHPQAFGVTLDLEMSLPDFVTHDWAQRLFALD